MPSWFQLVYTLPAQGLYTGQAALILTPVTRRRSHSFLFLYSQRAVCHADAPALRQPACDYHAPHTRLHRITTYAAIVHHTPLQVPTAALLGANFCHSSFLKNCTLSPETRWLWEAH